MRVLAGDSKEGDVKIQRGTPAAWPRGPPPQFCHDNARDSLKIDEKIGVGRG